MTREQVWQRPRAVDDLRLPMTCDALGADFGGALFPGPSCPWSLPRWGLPAGAARWA